MDKKQIEEKLINMFWYQHLIDRLIKEDEEAEEKGMYFRGVEDARPFDGNLVTMDNGVIVDLADGTQIRLTIQIS